MENKQQLTLLLAAVLQPNNPLRQEDEKEVLRLREQFTDHFMSCLSEILRGGADSTVKTLAAMLLRQGLSNTSPPSAQLWKRINAATQNSIKATLLETMKSEESYPLKKKISETVAELAVYIASNKQGEPWEGLVAFLFECVSGTDDLLAACGFRVLVSLFPFISETMLEHKEALFQVFSRQLESPQVVTRVACICAICCFLEVVELPVAMYYGELLVLILRSILWMFPIDKSCAEEGLRSLRDFAELEVNFFKNRTNLMLEFTEKICASELQLKYLSLDLLVSLEQKLAEGNAPVLCDKVFRMMVSADAEVDEQWGRPPEGYEEHEDSVELDYVLLGRKLFARMLENAADSLVLPGLLSIVKASVAPSVNEWRTRYAALMTVSELAQYMNDDQKIVEILSLLQTHLNKEFHPKLRYAVFMCIAELCEQYEGEIQRKSPAAVVPMILTGLVDPVQRVVAAAAAAACKFIEDIEQPLTPAQFSALFPLLISRLSQENCSFVIEKSLETITSLAENYSEAIVPYFTQIMQLLYNIVNLYKAPEYKRLRGKGIECMTTICYSVGKPVFLQISSTVVELLKSVQAEITIDDVLHPYILAAWQRLSVTLDKEFINYSAEIIPFLLKSVSTETQVYLSTDPATPINIESLLSPSQPVSLTTSDIENKEISMQTLLTIINVLKGSFSIYVQETASAIVPYVSSKLNETLRGSSASICAQLVLSLRESEDPYLLANLLTASKNMVGTILQAAEDEYDNEVLVTQLNSIKSILCTVNSEFLSSEEVNHLGETLIKVLDSSLKRRARNEFFQRDLSDDEDEKALISDLNTQDEDYLHLAISDLLGTLFRTHKMLSLDIIQFLYNNVLSNFLELNSTTNDKKFALSVVGTIIANVSSLLAADKLNSLVGALIKYSTANEEGVREIAANGIEALAIQTTPQVFSLWTITILQSIDTALQTPIQKSHSIAQESLISALSKIIRHQDKSVDLNTLVPTWLMMLPLHNGKNKPQETHELLADLCLNSIEVVIGADKKRLRALLGVFGDIIGTKRLSANTVPKICTILSKLQATGDLLHVWSSLTGPQQRNLTKLLSN